MERKIWLTPILFGVISIVTILISTSFILSLILQFSSLKESSIQMFILPITLITLFIGGFVAGFKSGSKGWYMGALTGTGFLIIIWMISFLGFDTALSLKNALIYGSYLLLATIGGVVGVNMSPNK